MSNELTAYSVRDIEQMAVAMAASKLFGVQNKEQAMALMLIAHAEGRHPALAAKDYDIIQGRPSKKSEAMLRDFLAGGGKVEWHTLTDAEASATFSHPQGGSVPISWDMKRATQAGLGSKDMWKKWPRQMLRARCISEGVRTVFPLATSGLYTPEEVKDIPATERPMKDVTPAPVAASQVRAAIENKGENNAAPKQAVEPPADEAPENPPHDAETGEIAEQLDVSPLLQHAEEIAKSQGSQALKEWYGRQSSDAKRELTSQPLIWSAIKTAAEMTDAA